MNLGVVAFFALSVAYVNAALPLTASMFERVSGNCKAEIGILLDGSGSVKKENWVQMLDFVNAIAKSVPFGQDSNRIGVATFGNEGTTNVRLSAHDSLDSFIQDVSTIPFKDEKTNTADGLRHLRGLFDDARPDVAKIAIIVTDGVATMETDLTRVEAKKIRDLDAYFYGLGIGRELNMSELEDIIAVKSRVYQVNDFSDLVENVNNIVFEACDAANQDPCYRKDIALVLDGSGSVGREGFELQKNFAKQLIRKIPLASEKNQVSIVVYSTEAFLKVNLGEIVDEQQLLNVIDGLEWLNQRTNTSGAARLLSRDVFSVVDVRDVSARVAVIMTDGKSNTDDFKLAREAAKLKEMGVRVFAVGVGPKSSPYELSLLSSTPTFYHTFLIKDFVSLASAEILEEIFSSVCAPEMPASAVELKPEYCQSDIVFAMTVSETTTDEALAKERELIKSTITSLGAGQCRYGLAVLGREAYIAKKLEDFTTIDDFIKAVDAVDSRRDYSDFSKSLIELASQFRYRGGNVGRMVPGAAERMSSVYDHSAEPRFLSNLDEDISLTPYDRLVGSSHGHGINEVMDAARLLVILTDGNDIESPLVINAAVQALHRAVPLLHVMAVGISETANTDVLKALASEPHSLHVMKNNIDDLLSTGGIKLAQAISAVASPVQWTCDFEKKDAEGILESNTCGFNQENSGGIDWLLKEGETLSKKTGPLSAVNGSFYAYIEATGKLPGDHAVLLSREFDGETTPLCLGFYYNMFGWHIGQLEVFTRHSDGSERVHWSIYGEQGQDWHMGMVHLLMKSGMSIGFRATRAEEFSGDIGIDAITLHRGACPMEKAWSAEDADYYWALGDLATKGPRGIRG